ncbi:putative Zinc finger, BED-type, partial [Corchorus olitorius]
MSSMDPIGSPVDIQVDVESESSEEAVVLTQLDASTQQQQSTAFTAGQGTSNPSQSVVSNEIPSRKRALTSNVWDHASKYNDPTGYPMARCNYCPKVFKVHSKINGISSLRNH